MVRCPRVVLGLAIFRAKMAKRKLKVIGLILDFSATGRVGLIMLLNIPITGQLNEFLPHQGSHGIRALHTPLKVPEKMQCREWDLHVFSS